MKNFLDFANQTLQGRVNGSEAKLDLVAVTKILQGDLDRQIISPDSALRKYYDFYKELDDDKLSYQQQYVGVGKGDRQEALRDNAHEFFSQIKEKYPTNIDAINLLEQDLTKKIGEDVDEQAAMAFPYLMLQSITYFDQIDKIQDDDKHHFLGQFPMSTAEEYMCAGGFSSRLNPLLMMLNAENVHLTSAHQSAVSSSSLNKGVNVHQQAMMNALFGINLKDEHYRLPAGGFTAQELWQGYVEYHVTLQEQFLLQQEQVKQDVIDLATLFDKLDDALKEGKYTVSFSKELKEKFSLKDSDFYAYDEDFMPIGIDDEKVKVELEKRVKNYYPRGIDMPTIFQQDDDVIKDLYAPQTAKMMKDAFLNDESSQSERNVAFNYLWIMAVKELNNSNTAFILSKVTEEYILQLLDENRTDEEIKLFFEQKEKELLATLEQTASFDDSALFQDKLFLIKDNLVFEEVSGKEDLLFCVVKNGYVEALNSLLEDDRIDVNRVKRNGATALMLAARDGRVEVIEKLLAVEGIAVNQAKEDGTTPLIIAAQYGHIEVVEKLLAVEGIAVNQAKEDGTTPLIIAIQDNQIEVVEKLLAAPGIDVNKDNHYNGATALSIAVQDNHIEVVEKLLAAPGIDVNKDKFDGTTPLMMAVKNSQLAMIEKLLDIQGIDVHKAKKDGGTPLMVAIHNGYTEVVDKIFRKLCIDGCDTQAIAYVLEDRPKIVSDANKISSFANQLCSFTKSGFNFSEAGQEKLTLLARKSLFKEIFSDENRDNIDSITAHFDQNGVVQEIAMEIATGLQSCGEFTKPSKSKLALIPFNNPQTLNTEHEGIEALVSDSIKKFEGIIKTV